MSPNPLTQLLGIRYPLIQAGMVWVSGWRLASAVSNSGGLGILGAGSMYPEVVREHIQKCKAATTKPFGVNVPLMYPNIDKLMSILIEEKVSVVITSAGNPSLWTAKLKAAGCIVLHVVSSLKFALKAQESGVDAIIAEGFEAGGHNGREETTTLVLVPLLRKYITTPLVAAGGIATGLVARRRLPPIRPSFLRSLSSCRSQFLSAPRRPKVRAISRRPTVPRLFNMNSSI